MQASLLACVQDYSYRLSVVLGEQSSQAQELRKQLSSTEEELQRLKRDEERATGAEADRLQSLLREKEAFIKVRSPSRAALLAEQNVSSNSHPLNGSRSGAAEGSGGVRAAVLERRRG